MGDIRAFFQRGDDKDGTQDHVAQGIVGDAEYAERIRQFYPEYSEKPLSEQAEPIAVIGLGCRLPGDVKSAHDFWDLMMHKKSGRMEKVPKSRFDIDAHYHENNDRPGSFAVKGGYFLNETCREFDAAFFNVSPIEAMWMDPQQRKLLEVVYETLESAGVTLSDIAGSQTAVFAAYFAADAQQIAIKEPSFRHALAATGCDPSIISNRISHVFDLRGPSAVINTACSSSLYAIHAACSTLRNRECSAAVVGGVNLVLTVDQQMNTAKMGVLSKTSTCHTFDASANGYGRAEGVGAVYLKRLSDAIRDGDAIRGILRSSATNYNGKNIGAGMTTPSIEGQRGAIQSAYSRGGDLDVRLTGFFECHGTGTKLGDPLEVEAVSLAMNHNRRPEEGPLIIGGVKPNIGHGEAVSGLSSLIKAVMAVERGIIPPTRGVTNPSPEIKWDAWQVAISSDPIAFPNRLPVKRVSVNAFGYGGTNAHVIIESADSLLIKPQTYRHRRMIQSARIQSKGEKARPHLLAFSAHDNGTLRRNMQALGGVVGEYDLLDVAYTLANRRTRFNNRGAVVTSSETADRDFSHVQSLACSEIKSGKKPVLGFLFTGQGAQWARMGAELMDYYPSFAHTINLLDATLGLLDDRPAWTIRELLRESPDTSRVNEAEFSQPLCTAIQVALVQLLQGTWDVKPKVCVGHSSGEIAAAFSAGLISSADAIVAAYYRGKVVRDLDTQGAMLAVGLGAIDVDPYLRASNGKVIIACHNSPSSVTLSGNGEAVETVRARLEADQVFARILKTNGKAYHSEHMRTVSAKYERLVREARGKYDMFGFRLPADAATMVSSVYNAVLPADTRLDEKYWSENLLSPVLFNQAVQTVFKSADFADVDLFIEIGPHSALSGPVRQVKTACQLANLNYLPSLMRNTNSAASVLRLAGELFMRNYDVDLSRVTGVEESNNGRVVVRSGCFVADLPTYQWDKSKEYSAEGRMSREHRAQSHMRHDILGSLVLGASKSEPTWRNLLRLRDVPWLKDHSLGGEAVFPTSGYLSMAMEAITQMNEISAQRVSIDSYTFRDVSIKNALVTPDDENGIEVIFNMRPSSSPKARGGGNWWDFHVSSIDQSGVADDHMTGSIAINNRASRPVAKTVPQLDQRSSGKAWNQALRNVGFDYGPTFQGMDRIRFDGKTYAAASNTLLQTKVDGIVGESRHILHPACVDSCFQLCIVAIYAGRSTAMPCGAVPTQIDEVSIWVPTPEQLEDAVSQAYSWVGRQGLRHFELHNQLVSSDGQVVMEVTDMRCTLYEGAVPQSKSEPAKPRPYADVVWKQDVEHVLTNPCTSQVDLAGFVELLEFKHSGIQVVDVDGSNVDELLLRMPELDLVFPAEDESDFLASLKQGSFDLVICSSETVADLASYRKLLHAGGRVAVLSASPAPEKALTLAGFTGIEKEFNSFYTAALKLLTSRDRATDRTVQIVSRDDSPAVQEAGSQLRTIFELGGYHVVSSNVKDQTSSVCENILLLTDLERPFLADMTEDEFYGLQRLMNATKNVVWVTTGDLGKGGEPEYDLTSGFTRSLRSEQASLNIMTIDFDEASKHNVVRIAAQKLLDQMCGDATEQEYAVINDQVFISRVNFDQHLNETYCVDEQNLQEKTVEAAGSVVGKIQNGQVVFEATQAEDPIQDDQVEVEVRASGLNKEDVLVANDTDLSAEFSREMSGVVRKVGKNVTDLVKGDFVFGFSFSKLSTLQRVPRCFVQKFKDESEMCAMAGLPMAFGAASHGLNTLAHIGARERLLILPGSGLAGHASIQIARSKGAVPYLGVVSESEAEAVASLYNVPAEQVIPIQKLEELRSTNSGVFEFDVIWSSGWVDATIVREIWRCIAPFGRLVECGRNTARPRAHDLTPSRNGANYIAFDLNDMYAHRRHHLGTLMRDVAALYKAGEIVPLGPLIARDIGNVNVAISQFSDNYTSGKTVLVHKARPGCENFKSIKVIPAAPRLRLRPDVSYLLVGCLGGLGRSLTSWMMSKGAKAFVFLSRTGADSKQAASLVQNIQNAGAHVTVVRGDASVRADVDRAVATVDPTRPIRGVIHAAMVLRDGLFHNMSYKNWRAATCPKVQGARNLHDALANQPLDFFVMTSSIAGAVGNPAQSNYAAANTYLDALARHRVHHGRRAMSIGIPMVLGIGVVAENLELETSLKRKGMYGIDDESLMAAFEAAMIEQTDPRDGQANIIAGLDPLRLEAAVAEAGEDLDCFWRTNPRFKEVVRAMSSTKDGAAEAGNAVLAQLTSGQLAGSAARDAVAAHMASKLSRMLMTDLADVQVDEGSITSYGIDSMIGAELRTWIFKELAVDVPFQQLLGASFTILKFAEFVCFKHGV